MPRQSGRVRTCTAKWLARSGAPADSVIACTKSHRKMCWRTMSSARARNEMSDQSVALIAIAVGIIIAIVVIYYYDSTRKIGKNNK
jgi:hypothetical protein